jgi:hypothetical protein
VRRAHVAGFGAEPGIVNGAATLTLTGRCELALAGERGVQKDASVVREAELC